MKPPRPNPTPSPNPVSLADFIDPDPTGRRGNPVFRGTTVPVQALFDHLAAGDPADTFTLDFPEVTPEQITAVLAAAKRHLLKSDPW